MIEVCKSLSRWLHLSEFFSQDLWQGEETMAKLSKAGVLGILRAKNADAAIERGIELVSLGLRAIEVTLDTVQLYFWPHFFCF